MLADDTRFANPLVSRESFGAQVSYWPACMLNKQAPESKYSITNNIVKFNFYPPYGKHPTRLWMKFPIEPEDVSAELAKYRQFDEFELPAREDHEGVARDGGRRR